MAAVWLVRHAVPLIAPGTCYGRLDMPADATATQQAAEALAAALPTGTVVWSSPRKRCTALANALLSLRPDLSYRQDARLAEMDFGGWEGRAWDALPRAALDAWTADFAHHTPGGGESVAVFMARVAAAWDTLPPDGPVAWIAHGGVARAATLIAQGRRHIARADDWPHDGPGFGAWVVVDRRTGAMLDTGPAKDAARMTG